MYNNSTANDELLTYAELADILKLKVKTIQNWKSLGVFKPSDYIKYGTTDQSEIRFKKPAIFARIKNGKFIK